MADDNRKSLLERIGEGVGREISAGLDALGNLRDLGGDTAVKLLELGREKDTRVVLEVAEAANAVPVGLMEGMRGSGLDDTAALVPKLLDAGVKMLVPGSAEGRTAGEGIAYLATHPATATKAATTFAEGMADHYVEFLDDPIKMAKEDPLGALDALTMLGAPAAVATRQLLVKAGKAGAYELIKPSALEAAAHQVGTSIGEKAVRLQRRAKKAGVDMTEAEAIESVIASDPSVAILRRSSLDPAPIPTPAPFPHGQEKRWIKASGKDGEMAYGEFRNGRNMENLVKRLVHDRNKVMFRGLNADAKSGLSIVLNRMDIVNGEKRFGGILRAGTVRTPKNRAELGEFLAKIIDDPNEIEAILASPGKSKDIFFDFAEPGTRISDRVIMGASEGGETQLYRIVPADVAEAQYKRLLAEHPEVDEVLEAFLAAKETPIVTFQGMTMPKFARKELKAQYNVKGLDQAEADIASHLFRQTFGKDAFPDNQLWQFNWVPESAEHSPGLGGRFRNQLRSWTEGSRKRKRGFISEAVEASGEGLDLEKGLTKAQTGLAIEPIRENTMKQVLSLAAEPLTPDDIARLSATEFASDALDGYTVMSATDLFGGAGKMRKFVKRNREWFTEQGIDVPDVVNATYLAGGKGYKVPNQIASDLGAYFNPQMLDSMKGLAKFDQAVGDLVRVPLTFWLSRPSTANRNFISQAITFAPAVIRDFYAGLFQSIPLARYEDLPWQDFLSNFSAMGKMHGRQLRREIPEELVGSTFMSEMARTPLQKGAALPLRLFGFNYHDVSFKRLNIEKVIDSNSKKAWRAAQKAGETGGRSKEEFIRNYRANVPPEIVNLAMRESDIWGGYDYGSVTEAVELIRRSNTLRAGLPYPTWISKFWGNTGHELGLTPMGFARNIKKLAPAAVGGNGSKAEKVRALANLMTGATVSAIAYETAGDIGNLAKELTDSETRRLAEETEELTGRTLSEKDLFPATQRKIGRVELPMSERLKDIAGMAEDETLHTRMTDLPWFGDAMWFKAIRGGHATFGEYMNERVALGPMVTAISIMTGLENDYNKNQSTGTKVGKLVADVLPLGNELEVARKLTDPSKRQLTGPKGTPFWKDFIAGLANRVPVLSDLVADDPTKVDIGIPGVLQPRVGQNFDAQIYGPVETLGSYFLLNTRKLSASEREAAISALAIRDASEMRKEVDRETLLPHVMAIVNANGRSVEGEAYKNVKGSDPEVQRKITMTLNAVKIAQAGNIDGPDAAIAKYQEVLQAIPPHLVPTKQAEQAFISSALGVLQKHIRLDQGGMLLFVRMQTPSRLRPAFDEAVAKGRLEAAQPN